jgi:hypothetical protein
MDISPIDIDLRNNLRVLRDRVEQLREEIDQLRAKPCPYVTGKTTQYCTLTPFTLTEEERVAITSAYDDYARYPDPGGRAQHIAMRLKGLLDRAV